MPHVGPGEPATAADRVAHTERGQGFQSVGCPHDEGSEAQFLTEALRGLGVFDVRSAVCGAPFSVGSPASMAAEALPWNLCGAGPWPQGAGGSARANQLVQIRGCLEAT